MEVRIELDRVSGHFLGGDEVHGRVVLDCTRVSSATSFKSVTLHVHVGMNVSWSKPEWRPVTTNAHHGHHAHHSRHPQHSGGMHGGARSGYINMSSSGGVSAGYNGGYGAAEMEQVMVKVEDSGPLAELPILLETKAGSVGAHEVKLYPFAFGLPVDEAGSMVVPTGGAGTESVTGSVAYTLKAMVARSGLKFNVGSPVVPFTVAPLYNGVPGPTQASGWGAGGIAVTLSLDTCAASPGATIKAHLHVENPTGMSIPSVDVELVQSVLVSRRSPPETAEKSFVVTRGSRPGTQAFLPLTTEVPLATPALLWASVATPLLRNSYTVVARVHLTGADVITVAAPVTIMAPQVPDGSQIAKTPFGTPMRLVPAAALPSVIRAPPPGVDLLPLDGTETDEKKVRLKAWHMYYFDVPELGPHARLDIALRGTSKATLALRLRKESQPSLLTSYDFAATRGASKHDYELAISPANGTPLSPGRWFCGVWGTNMFPPSSRYVLSARLEGAVVPSAAVALQPDAGSSSSPPSSSSYAAAPPPSSSSVAEPVAEPVAKPVAEPVAEPAAYDKPPTSAPPSFDDNGYLAFGGASGATSATTTTTTATATTTAPAGASLPSTPTVDDADLTNISPSDLVLGDVIGSGAFGEVRRGTWRGGDVAIKTIKMGSLAADAAAEFKAEARLMRRIPPHPNVVQVLGVCQLDDDNMCIVSSFERGGSLLALLDGSSPFPWTAAKKLDVAIGIAAGLVHLSSEGIVHRDLAARNILVAVHGGGPSATVLPKITDFGMSREAADGAGTTASAVGPVKWMAVEAITQRAYSPKSDVWSFGVLLFELFGQTEPYAGVPPLQVAIGVSNGTLSLDLTGAAVPIPAPVADLIAACMARNPDDRPGVPDLIGLLKAAAAAAAAPAAPAELVAYVDMHANPFG